MDQHPIASRLKRVAPAVRDDRIREPQLGPGHQGRVSRKDDLYRAIQLQLCA